MLADDDDDDDDDDNDDDDGDDDCAPIRGKSHTIVTKGIISVQAAVMATATILAVGVAILTGGAS